MAEPRCPSYYTASLQQESDYPQLQGDVRVDIAIVGGGFSGVNTALELAERGYKVGLVEANKIGWGATGRNGGQVTGSLSGQGAMLKQMRRTLGADVGEFVWNLRWRGQKIIRDRTDKYGIECDLKNGHLQAAYKPSHIPELRADYDEIQGTWLADQVQWLDKAAVADVIGTELYHAALRNNYNMHVHPLNLCLGEARAATGLGVHIFEDSPVLHVEHRRTPTLVTARGRMTADTVILAGNAYHHLEREKLAGYMFPAVLNIVTTAPLTPEQVQSVDPEDLAVYDTRFVLDYYRLTADKRLLFGGGTNYSGRDSADIGAELRPRMEHTFPQLKGIALDFKWEGTVGIVINRIPMIGRVRDNVYYLQGYSGHGIATTHVMSEIMAEAITGTMNRFDAFTAVDHLRIPFGDHFGNALLAIGMQYYLLRERWH